VAKLKVSTEEAGRRLGEVAIAGEELIQNTADPKTERDSKPWMEARDRWIKRAAAAIGSVYEEDSRVQDFATSVTPVGGFRSTDSATAAVSTADELTAGAAWVREGVNALQSLLETLPYDEEPFPTQPQHPSDQGAATVAPQGPIFLVHGHSDVTVHHVVRVLREATGRAVTVLREMPSGGRVVLEKFEEHAASAAYAVVLLTADDEGHAKTDSDSKPRARQNVVFELGFFFAQLGRKRVAVLRDPEVEKPSDLDGLVYIEIDPNEAWKHKLIKELKAVGIEVDFSKIP
jgi:predicted nucleotide-binding protein